MTTHNSNNQDVESWSEYNVLDSEYKVEYQFHTPKESSAISLMMSGQDEMLRIAEDGFYVRGQRVPADDKEAAAVYHAFKQWLAWANLQRK